MTARMHLSPRAVSLALQEKLVGELVPASHRGVAGDPGGGPFLVLTLLVDRGLIQEAKYKTFGCPTAKACGAATCLLVKGRPVERALLLVDQDLISLLEGVPEGKEYCPKLAIDALKDALRSELR